jgi:hypothetical protein
VSDFFAALELELRAAAERGPRRRPGLTAALRVLVPAAVTLALLGVALVPAVVLLGDGGGDAAQTTNATELPPVGTVYEPGEGRPPRETRSTVVATGVAPVAGPWQMETYGSTRLADPETGEEYQPAGLRCLGIFLLDPPEGRGRPSGGGQCGEFPRTPGFSRVEMTVRSAKGEVEEILVYGRVPAEAAAVVVTVDGVERRRLEPLPGPSGVDDDFYLVATPPQWEGGRVNWIDANGNEGSRGHELLPR